MSLSRHASHANIALLIDYYPISGKTSKLFKINFDYNVGWGNPKFVGVFSPAFRPPFFIDFKNLSDLRLSDLGVSDGDLFVTYAKQNAAEHDGVAGPGNGFVEGLAPSRGLLVGCKHLAPPPCLSR